MIHLWLRAETKKNEKRSALTPKVVDQLIATGQFKITVEKSSQRIFKDEEYKNVTFAQEGDWMQAPVDTFIIGLKELPEGDHLLKHQHILFAHAFKGQTGWKELLKRFVSGGGSVLDLEFLKDTTGRRVAAFGYYAGYAGAAVGVLIWAQKQKKLPVTKISSYPNEEALVTYVKEQIKGLKVPSMLVIGALGRCGTGAVDFGKRIGMSITQWDMAETKKGGPFVEITQHDIFVNCIYLTSKIAPFLTKDMCKNAKLQVVVDVSCDPNNENNPIPIYSECTTFDSPVVHVVGTQVDVVAIDHLPTLLPREASNSFCDQLLPSLKELPLGVNESRVWRDALALFKQKCSER